MVRQIARRLFRIPVSETSLPRRGFYRGGSAAQERFETIGATFLLGYHAGLDIDDTCDLRARLDEIEPLWRGIAFEGAGMALSLLDQLSLGRSHRWKRLLDEGGRDHIYLLHIGVGWTLARFHRSIRRALPREDPLLCWLAADGYGFHAGYFGWPRYIVRQEQPRRWLGYSLRVFDQGLGRSLWFVDGAEVERIGNRIERFPPDRRGDLWSGIGLACAYAGGIVEPALGELCRTCGVYGPQLMQGVAFAAEARRLGNNAAAHTDMACRIIAKMSPGEASQVVMRHRENLPPDGAEPAYAVWRRRIQQEFQMRSP